MLKLRTSKEALVTSRLASARLRSCFAHIRTLQSSQFMNHCNIGARIRTVSLPPKLSTYASARRDMGWIRSCLIGCPPGRCNVSSMIVCEMERFYVFAEWISEISDLRSLSCQCNWTGPLVMPSGLRLVMQEGSLSQLYVRCSLSTFAASPSHLAGCYFSDISWIIMLLTDRCQVKGIVAQDWQRKLIEKSNKIPKTRWKF